MQFIGIIRCSSKTEYSESWSNSAFHCCKIWRSISVSKFFGKLKDQGSTERIRWSIHPWHQTDKTFLDHPLMILLIFVMVHMRPMIYCAVRSICLQRLFLTCCNLDWIVCNPIFATICNRQEERFGCWIYAGAKYLIELSVVGE